jgi:predicted transcriptional regulator of viral defense system
MSITSTRSIRTLNPSETRLLNALSVAGKTTFTAEEAQSIAGGEVSNLPRLLSRLTQKRWLLRLERGKYLILPLAAGMEGAYTAHEFVLASRLVQPYAIAYWSALHFHGFTEQIPQTVTVLSPLRRRDVAVEELGFRCHFVYTAAERFFGATTAIVDDQPVVITDPARTILDCLDRPDLCGGIIEAAKGMYGYVRRSDASPQRLTEYASRLGNQAVLKRLGYLASLFDLAMEFPGAGWSDVLNNWAAHLSAGFVRLDPRLPAEGPYDRRWRLRLNVSETRLTEWLQT